MLVVFDDKYQNLLRVSSILSEAGVPIEMGAEVIDHFLLWLSVS